SRGRRCEALVDGARIGISKRFDAGVPAFGGSDQCSILQAADEVAGVRDRWRPGVWEGRGASLAPGVVWSEGIFSMVGIEVVQDACAGVAVAVSGVYAVSGLQREAVSAGGVAL